VLKAARILLEEAEGELHRAEDAYARGLYVLALNASQSCMELCLRAASRVMGASWLGMGLAERAKLMEDWIVKRKRVDEGRVEEGDVEVEVRRAREAVEALRSLLEELEEALEEA